MSLIPEKLLSGAHRSLADVGLDRDVPPIRRNVEGGVDYDYYLARARAMRSEAWGTAFKALGRGLNVLFVGWLKPWREWRQRRRAIEELYSMDDRMLRDLGLGRTGIFYAVDHGREDLPAPANANANASKPRAA